MIVQFRKGDTFRIAIELFVLLFVGHSTEFTPGTRQAKQNKDRISLLLGGLDELQEAAPSFAPPPFLKNFKFFEMSASKIFR